MSRNLETANSASDLAASRTHGTPPIDGASKPRIRQEDDEGFGPPTVEGPRPLYREMPPATPFPLKAMGPVLGQAARAIEAHIRCPIECAANSVLAVASHAAQAQANAILPIGEGRPVPLSLFFLTILESGERKSFADGLALKPVREFESELAEAATTERRAHAAKAAAWEAKSKQLTNKHKADPATLETLLLDLGPAPQPPLSSLLSAGGDQTMEGMFRLYQHGRPSLAMLCDDAGSFLGGHSLRAEQKASSTANLCRAWDGKPLERIRGGDGVTILYDRRLACHLMTQPVVASDFLSDRQFVNQGLVGRFLLSAPRGTAGSRFRPDDAAYIRTVASVATALEDYCAAVNRLLRRPVRWKNEDDRSLGVKMDSLPLTTEARALFVDFCNEIEGGLGVGGELAMVKPAANKLPEQAVRLAGVLALIAGDRADTITEGNLADGIELARFYLSEALRLTAVGLVDPNLRQADVLRGWLLAGGKDMIALSSVYQTGPSFVRQADKARELMRLLEEHGWARYLQSGAQIDGVHHRQVWQIFRD